MDSSRTLLLVVIVLSFFLLNQPVSSTDFVFNSFNSSSLLLYGIATTESSVLTLTNTSSFSIGRALYPQPIPTRPPNSSQLLPFSTSFIFSISPSNELSGHGFAFLFVPTTGINGTTSAQHLGLLNGTNNNSPDNHVFAVEFDVFENEEFNDTNDNHVGINVNSLTSVVATDAGYWDGDEGNERFREQRLNNHRNYQVWIDYRDSQVNVTMVPAGMRRPDRPLISASVDLSEVFLDRMYVGFTAATGRLVQSHRILSWSFSNANSSIGGALITRNLPSFGNSDGSVFSSKGFIVGISIGSVVLVTCGVVVFVALVKRRRSKEGKVEKIEDWEVEYWPHRIDYQEVYKSSNGFSDKNVIGYGGNGNVFKGVLAKGVEVAIKRISLETEHGIREFLAEISSLGRLKHRNLVGLRGWCKTDKRSLMLVYDYMENGSLDKWLHEGRGVALNWNQRINILKDIASGILYLHEGWEARVLHRDIKASNVLLDKDMNARLGDFGLARMQLHGQVSNTTIVVGTVGYMAPELIRTGRASALSDIFAFGVLILEVVSGRRPVEEGKPGLVEQVYKLMQKGKLVGALDERLSTQVENCEEEVEKVLQLGLRCTNPEPNARPSMRTILKALEDLRKERTTDSETNGVDDSMEFNFAENMRSSTMWSDYYQNLEAGYPRYEDIQRGLLSSSLSLSGSDVTVNGR